MDVQVAKYFATAIVMVSTIGSAYAIATVAKAGLEGMARNPEAGGNLMTGMILAIAFSEALAIYALVVAFLILFG